MRARMSVPRSQVRQANRIANWLLFQMFGAASARAGEPQLAAIRWPQERDERKAQSDLYGRCFTPARKERARTVDAAEPASHRGEVDACRES